jgi:hypothetical protein
MTVSILVVDDELDLAALFRQRFRREMRQGTYAMRFATSGEEALNKLDDGIVPTLMVILSDINMPGMDGLTLPGSHGSNGCYRRVAPATIVSREGLFIRAIAVAPTYQREPSKIFWISASRNPVQLLYMSGRDRRRIARTTNCIIHISRVSHENPVFGQFRGATGGLGGDSRQDHREARDIGAVGRRRYPAPDTGAG